MRSQYLLTSLAMQFRMLFRRRIVLFLLIGIPCLFIIMVNLTTSGREVFFQVGIDELKTMVKKPEMNVSLVFVSMGTIGFLSSFLSLNLVQQHRGANRRLVICGYHPSELLLSGLIVMLFIVFILTLCVGFSIISFFEPMHPVAMMSGLLYAGLTYGSYGILVGSLVKGELEGSLLVILLANIDAGWLQNPLFFSGARNKFIIQLLPAYFPSQVSIASAFTDLSVQKPALISLAYSIAFLSVAMIVSYMKMKIRNR